MQAHSKGAGRRATAAPFEQRRSRPDHATTVEPLVKLNATDSIIAEDNGYRYLLHDRDSIFARHLDKSIRALGLSVLKSPPRCPKANAICERVIGTIRRECLDWLIPMSERHLRSMLKSWVEHYNRGRPHSSLGPGVPDPPPEIAVIRNTESRHRLAAGSLVLARSVLAGLHHEYLLAPAIA
jgi:hypothetical protein